MQDGLAWVPGRSGSRGNERLTRTADGSPRSRARCAVYFLLLRLRCDLFLGVFDDDRHTRYCVTVGVFDGGSAPEDHHAPPPGFFHCFPGVIGSGDFDG